MSDTAIHAGSCHCGRIAFTVQGALGAVVSCNCSICARKGALLWAVPRERLSVAGSLKGIGRYVFGRGRIAHRFCPTCGMHPFAEDVGEGGDRLAYVNVRCLEGVDPAALEIVPFDGRSVP